MDTGRTTGHTYPMSYRESTLSKNQPFTENVTFSKGDEGRASKIATFLNFIYLCMFLSNANQELQRITFCPHPHLYKYSQLSS